MSNAIGLLEAMGRDAGLRHADRDEVRRALAQAPVDPEVHAAILGKDRNLLETLLDAPVIVCCAQDPGRNDDDEIVAQTAAPAIAAAA